MSQVMNAPAWTIPGFLEARENQHLFISGADATALSYKYGTPLFVFSEARIRANIARLQAAAKQVERPIKFCYASKANSNMAVLSVVRDAGIDIEVNSGGELFKALRAGFRFRNEWAFDMHAGDLFDGRFLSAHFVDHFEDRFDRRSRGREQERSRAAARVIIANRPKRSG